VPVTGQDWIDPMCPFLRARDGTWRAAAPMREHRCWAVDPPAELPVLTQQRLCLHRTHDGCERFVHARELRAASLAERIRGAVGAADDVAPVPQTAPSNPMISPVALPRARPAAVQASRRPSPRRLPPIARVANRPRARPLLTGASVAIMAVAIVAAWAVRPVEQRGVVPSALPAQATVAPPAPTPVAGAAGTYAVREGDTLRSIAERFGITVRELRAANTLGDPPVLTPGMVLVIPSPNARASAL
jgi:LysM repeat protein